MDWLANVPHPFADNLENLLSLVKIEDRIMDKEIYLKWISGKILGDPKAIEGKTVRELRREGYCGLYK